MVSDDTEDPVLQKATGTTIQWASGKNPGVKVDTLGCSKKYFTFIIQAAFVPGTEFEAMGASVYPRSQTC